jgi:hypothetical protein
MTAEQIAEGWASLAAVEKVCAGDQCPPGCPVRAALLQSVIADSQRYAEATQATAGSGLAA